MKKPMDAKTFDTKFDEGASVMPHADVSKAQHPSKTQRPTQDNIRDEYDFAQAEKNPYITHSKDTTHG